jgi:hypothetical protein
LFVGGDSSMNGNLYVSGSNATITGKTILGGDISLNTRLFVGGDSSMNGNLYSNNTLVNKLNIGTASGGTFTYQLDVSGTIRLNSTIAETHYTVNTVPNNVTLNYQLGPIFDISTVGFTNNFGISLNNYTPVNKQSNIITLFMYNISGGATKPYYANTFSYSGTTTGYTTIPMYFNGGVPTVSGYVCIQNFALYKNSDLSSGTFCLSTFSSFT